jgi:hypothetical protein
MSHKLHTFITALLPRSHEVRLTALTVTKGAVQLQLSATAPTTCCPRCAAPSSSVHSRYQRHLTALSWGVLAVSIQLIVRKFVCRLPIYKCRIFTYTGEE